MEMNWPLTALVGLGIAIFTWVANTLVKKNGSSAIKTLSEQQIKHRVMMENHCLDSKEHNKQQVELLGKICEHLGKIQSYQDQLVQNSKDEKLNIILDKLANKIK